MDEQDSKFAIHAASRDGKTSLVESLLNANPKLSALVDDDGRLPIHWACAYNHLPIINLLMNIRRPPFDPDVTDASGWTPLMISCSLPNGDGSEAVNLLLSKDADPNLKTNGGQTALHFATSKQNLDICRTLLANKAVARTKDKRGQLPLHRAAAIGNVPILRLLLKEGKSPLDATDIDGSTALHHAISEGHGDIAIELMKAGADITKKDWEDRLAIELVPDSKVRKYIIQQAEKEGIDLP
ncbi:putative proteasome regulatory particle subunit [Phaeomoniella chlamydospora]|uniref:Putative proteasome regulatory particle subunit n=1 Tax=Phaeomoniella chlamydospora TaxID=158046 RepID=A0A0G2EP94_PHACM|nr:putative proteasome regulatory particle subunit [Phaeomoniella chlamydospora]